MEMYAIKSPREIANIKETLSREQIYRDKLMKMLLYWSGAFVPESVMCEIEKTNKKILSLMRQLWS